MIDKVAPQFGYPTEKSFEHPDAIPTPAYINDIQKLIDDWVYIQGRPDFITQLLNVLSAEARNQLHVGRLSADEFLTKTNAAGTSIYK